MTFNPTPSVVRDVTVSVGRSVPSDADAVGVPVATKGSVPRQLGLDRATLTVSGFDGKVGQTLVLPRRDGPALVAVGIGNADELTTATLRDAAAAFARAAGKHGTLATALLDAAGGLAPDLAAQAVVEGIVLARYRYGALKREVPTVGLREIALIVTAARANDAERGAARGMATARAASLARDLANTPPGHLTATRMAEIALAVGAAAGLDVEVFDEAALTELACGGMLGVNAGSTEPPRMIKLSYRPEGAGAHLALVGKGVMYDSGGISLKPSDQMHASMKMDMSGAAAVLSSMSALARARVPGERHRVPDVHGQHAVGFGDEARRRADDPWRHDRRDPQHRRRGPPRARRRPRAGR